MADFGGWGFTGLLRRAIELPSAVIPGIFTAAVSPTQRARIRYNDVLKQLEASVDGTPYVAIALGAGGASPFVEAAGVIRQVNPASQVVLGALLPTGSEQLRVDGDVIVNSAVFVDDLVSTPAGTGSVLRVSSDDGGVDIELVGGQPFQIADGINPIFTADRGLGFNSVNTVDSAVRLGIRDGVIDAFRVQQAASVYIQANTTNGAESVDLGNTATSVSVSVADARARAFALSEGANDLLVIDTAAEQFSFGNVVENPTYSFQGTGAAGFGGPIIGSAQIELDELAVDPIGTANRGKVYTKDIAGITELFYRDSAGNIVQLTTGGSVSSGTDVAMTDNVDPGFLVHQAADDYIRIATTNGAEAIAVGNAVTNPTFSVLGAGLSTFSGSVLIDDTELQLGERVGDPGATANRGKVYTKDVAGVTELFYQDSAGNVIQLTTGGAISPATDIPIADNVDPAFLVHQAADDYIRIVTTNAAEAVSIGNAATNPVYNFLGTGTTTFNGPALIDDTQLELGERVGDPGATANRGKVYTKDLAGATELFYQDAAGNVVQLTSGGTLNILDVSLTDNVNPAYLIHQAADDYVRIITTNAAESIVLGTAAINPSLSVVGRPDFQVPDNTALAFQLREGANSYVQVVTTNAAEVITIGATAINPQLLHIGRPEFQLPDNTSGAFLIREAATANEYFTIDTTNGLERITLGERTGTTASLTQIHLHIDPAVADAFLVRDNSRTYFSVATSTGTISIGSSVSTPVLVGNGGAVTCEVPDNVTIAFRVMDPPANNYILVRTSNGTERVTLGNGVTDPIIDTQSLLEVNDSLRLNAPITPAALATGGTTNNYAPAGFLGSNVVLLTITTGGTHTLTGLVPPSDSNLSFMLFNASTAVGDNLILTHDDVASTAANRFLLPDNATLTLLPRSGIWLWYRAASDRWMTIGGGI